METCGPDTCISAECGSTYERRSPAGSSRPGSARLVHTAAHVAPGHMETTTTPKTAIHTRPRTIAAHPKPAAQATPRSTEAPADGIYKSKGNKPASDHKSTRTQQYNTSSSTSERTSVTRQKERLAERDMDREKDKKSKTEGDKQTSREKQKFTGMEMDKERRMSRTIKKQQDKAKEKKRDSICSKNQAAVVIQRAWRRYR